MNKITKIVIVGLGVAVLGLSIAVAVSYSNYISKANKVNELERRMSVLKGDIEGKAVLEGKVEELQKQIEFSLQEKKMLIPVMTLGMDFTKAYVNSNLDKIDPMIADKVLVLKELKKVYLVKDGDLKNKTLLFDTTQNLSLKEIILNDYEKVDDKTYFVELKQYFLDSKGNAYNKVGYLDLNVIDQKGSIKINVAKVTFKDR